MIGKLIGIVVFSLSTLWCNGHGDVHERIRLLTVQIEKHPHDHDLRFERGSLYLQHESYRKAIRDFRHGVRQGGNNLKNGYLLAKARFEMGQYQKCVRQLLKLTENQNGTGNIYFLLSRAYEQLGNLKEASLWLEKYFEQAVFKRPEHFLARAHLCRLQLESKQEIYWLETAVNQFGYLPSLVHPLLGAYKNAKCFSTAIELQSNLLEKQQRKEFALFERAQMYHLSGDDCSATLDLMQIPNEIDKLPAHIRAQKSITKLVEKTSLLLSTIDKGTP